MSKSERVMVCLLGASLLAGCGSSKPVPGIVAKNWTSNTEQLGIEAIYPPRGHFEVGDVFLARAVESGKKMKTADYVLGSVRIDHIDMSDELYSTAPTVNFQATTTYEDGKGGSVNTKGVLPLTVRGKVVNSQVAFPGFTFASLAESDIGVNVASGAIGALFGVGRRSQYTVSYSVPAAETYGVTYLEARRCFEREAPTRYTPKDRQMMLEAADQLKATQARPGNDSSPILVFVTDVYLTRAIDVVVSSEEGMSATFSALTMAMVELSDKKQALEQRLAKLGARSGTTPEPDPAAQAADAGKVETKEDKAKAEATAKAEAEKSAETKAAEAKAAEAKAAAAKAALAPTPGAAGEIEQVTAELATVNAQLRQQANQVVPDLPGATGSVVKSSALGVTLRQAFAQPVAIGYRGIHYNIATLGRGAQGGSPRVEIGKDVIPLKQEKTIHGLPDMSKLFPSTD
ncbi:hypothetical protein [Pseudomonas chlororaphis]|uniref:Lipoprotein n=1 Tax=Pseudomonas chlororaphis TaxID=587753 RepID=A0AAP9W092_9PSED|nr:hypothetical protein [Pseudomonas chlororaphis]AUG40593.1 hypothetical protein CXP47_12100 [Pseudomonas chlororaphis]QNR50205.1 hypothetical protein HLB40_12020 [Pseudomonas chlororaphis]